MITRQQYKTKFVFRDFCVPRTTSWESFLLLFYKEKRCLEANIDKEKNKVFIYKQMRGHYYFIGEENETK